MKLHYVGEGTIGIEGAGEVSAGGTIEVTDDLGRALLEERPQHFRTAEAAPSAPAGEQEG